MSGSVSKGSSSLNLFTGSTLWFKLLVFFQPLLVVKIHILGMQQRWSENRRCLQSLPRKIWVLNQKIGGFPPKWMVKIMENPINPWMIWGEKPPIFGFPPICWEYVLNPPGHQIPIYKNPGKFHGGECRFDGCWVAGFESLLNYGILEDSHQNLFGYREPVGTFR